MATIGSTIWSPKTCTCVSIQAKGELRAAQAEIDELKEDKAVLRKTLDTKAKEVRMQLLQVQPLTSETRLSAAPISLYRALPVFRIHEP